MKSRSLRFAQACAFLLFANPLPASTLYVANQGNDKNPGTEAKPLATIQAAVNKLNPGDTLLIRGGVYRETVTFPRDGAPQKPILIRSYNNEKVVISGCDPISGWSKHKNNIWKAPMPWTLGQGRDQVFGRGKVMLEARHPNRPDPGLEMPVADLSRVWPTFGNFSIPDATRISRPGRVVGSLLKGQTANYWKGAMYCGVHYAGWCMQTGVIESSADGEIDVTKRTDTWWFAAENVPGFEKDNELGRGMIVGHMNALDAAGEWFWEQGTLYLIPDENQEPNLIEAKKRQLALDLSNRSYISVVGVNVVGSSARLENSHFCALVGCSFECIAHYTIQEDNPWGLKGIERKKSGEAGIYLSGSDNQIVNSSISISAGAGVLLDGQRQTVHNCMVDQTGYTAHYLYPITIGFEHDLFFGGHKITYNTLKNSGRSWTGLPTTSWEGDNRKHEPELCVSSLFAHNHCFNGMLLTRDGGGFTSGGSSGGAVNNISGKLVYNVMHDIFDLSAMRWQKTFNLPIAGLIYLDEGTRDLDVHHNLLWAAPESHQNGLWINGQGLKIQTRDNVFYPNFKRSCSELKAEDFPNSQPFRFGHDFSDPPIQPVWPQLISSPIPREKWVANPKPAPGTDLKKVLLNPNDSLVSPPVDLSGGWQSAILRFSGSRWINGIWYANEKLRHQKPGDPIVLTSSQRDGGSPNLGKFYNAVQGFKDGEFVRFNKVPFGEGYRKFRLIYGTNDVPAKMEVRLDKEDGPIVGQLDLEKTGNGIKYPGGTFIDTFTEATADLSDRANGTRDVFIVFRSKSSTKTLIAMEYLCFEGAKGVVPLRPEEVKIELRLGNPTGKKIGEFYPRWSGPNVFSEFATRLEPCTGVQPLCLVICSGVAEPVGMIADVVLQKSPPSFNLRGIGIPPKSQDGHLVLPTASNRPVPRAP